MAAGNYHLYIEQGSDLSVPLEFSEDDDTAINLTGYKFAMQIRPKIGSSTVYDTLTSENGRITIEAANGKIYLKFPASVTNAYDFLDKDLCSAVFSLEWYSGGEYKRRLEGPVTISPDPTDVDLS